MDTRNGHERTLISALAQVPLLSALTRAGTRLGMRGGWLTLAACALLQTDALAQNRRTGGHAGAGGSLVDAPEINPKLVIGMAVLLVGGVLVLTARLRRRAKVN